MDDKWQQGDSMDDKSLGTGVAKKCRLSYKVLAVFMVSLVLGNVSIALIALEPWRTIFFTFAGTLFIVGLTAVLLLWVSSAINKAIIKSGVSPAPQVSLEDERMASSRQINKVLGSHLFVTGVGPLLLAVLVDLVTREMPADMIAPMTGWIYDRGTELALAFIAVYVISAKFYELKSGVRLMSFRYPPAKIYMLFRKEVGLRKLVVLIFLLFDAPARFGVGWVLVAGLYLFFVRTFI